MSNSSNGEDHDPITPIKEYVGFGSRSIGDDEVTLPKEDKNIFLVIKHSPTGLPTNDTKAARNFFYHVFEQVYDLDIKELSAFTRAHINQHFEALDLAMRDNPYENNSGQPVISRRLLTFILGTEKRDPGCPAYAWLNYAIQTFLESDEKRQKDVCNKCRNFFNLAPHGNWAVKKRKDERGP